MRPLRLILVCVLLGAVTTVGVAWGFAARRPSLTEWGVAGDGLLASRGQSVGRDWVEIHRIAHGASKAITIPAWCSLPEGQDEYVFNERTGWPSLALSGELYHDANLALQATVAILFIGDDHRVPLRPLPLGFTVDTAFYGVIWFALIVSPGFVRRRLRRRRGQCPSCGYDMQGSAGTCPECGNQIQDGPDQSQDHGQD